MNGEASPIDEAARLRPLLHTLVLALALAAAALLPTMRMTVDLASFAALLACVVALAIARPFVARVASPGLAAAFEITALLFGALVPVLVLSFAAMRLGAPLADARLAAADAFLHVDALAIVRRVDAMPLLAVILGFAYGSFALQVGLLPVLLALAGHRARACGFALAFLLLTVVASAIAAFFPALGTMAHAGLARDGFAHIDATYGYHFLRAFAAVRAAPEFALSAKVAAGVLTFPSVHAGVALLCGWGGWRLRSRWAWAALNVAMFASAVTHGAHYVVDLLAGGLLAVGIVAIVSRCGQAPAIDARRPVARDRQQPAGRAVAG